jgi:hypothetical protein
VVHIPVPRCVVSVAMLRGVTVADMEVIITILFGLMFSVSLVFLCDHKYHQVRSQSLLSATVGTRVDTDRRVAPRIVFLLLRLHGCGGLLTCCMLSCRNDGRKSVWKGPTEPSTTSERYASQLCCLC